MDLKEWTDLDIAMQLIGEALKILPEGSFRDLKYITNSANIVGNALYNILAKLVFIGFLERGTDDETDMQVRLNPKFDADKVGSLTEKDYFVLCVDCGGAIAGVGNVSMCGYPICECGEAARPDRIVIREEKQNEISRKENELLK